MDSYYDSENARNALEQIACVAPEGEDRRLASLATAPSGENQSRVVQFERPQTWRLVKDMGQDDQAMEELVFTVAGVISQIDFPPVTEKPSIATKQYKFLRQSVVLTGLGSATFDAVTDATRNIFEIFQREFPEGKLDNWEISRYQLHASLPVSNRYLTPKRDAPDMEHIPFGLAVDPRGYLESMTKDGFIHGEENVVEYYSAQNTKDGKKTFVKSNPQNFRVGDLVEVQVSFVVVQLKQQRYKMLSVLHTIALLDTKFSQNAMRKRAMAVGTQATTAMSGLSLKRRVGYESEQQTKKLTMDVDE